MNPQGDYKAVKEGWSWTAFLFTGIWALSHKLWKIGGFVLVGWFIWYFNALDMFSGRYSVQGAGIYDLVGAIQDSRNDGKMLMEMTFFVYLPGLILCIFFGRLGNKWLDNNLLARGYDNITTVEALTPEGAIATYLKEHKT